MTSKQRRQLVLEYDEAMKTMRELLREMPEASNEKIKAGLLVGQNALGKTALSLGLNAPETAVWLQFLATSYLASAMRVAEKQGKP